VWVEKGDLINTDLKRPQGGIGNHGLPNAILQADTGITAIDKAISEFYRTGYMHNHLRMYVASITCNVAGSYWQFPAQWMYYHLLDADWASNALSWQWVAGSNSNKKYYANQENINKYCNTHQKNTFLDVAYSDFENLTAPDVLKDIAKPSLTTPLPGKEIINIDVGLPTMIYNFYNLDPEWKKGMQANRVLLLEPSHFRKYPVSSQTLDFILKLSKNIKSLEVYVGEFDELVNAYGSMDIYYKEHPLSIHYKGTMENRDWMFNVRGYYPSFFGFWKKCKKELNY
ncbi:MAG: FAD-binding domain-containing protein, partial [Bacteroidota bacterium]